MVSVRGGMLRAAPPHLQETVTCAHLQHPAGPSGWDACCMHIDACMNIFKWFVVVQNEAKGTGSGKLSDSCCGGRQMISAKVLSQNPVNFDQVNS